MDKKCLMDCWKGSAQYIGKCYFLPLLLIFGLGPEYIYTIYKHFVSILSALLKLFLPTFAIWNCLACLHHLHHLLRQPIQIINQPVNLRINNSYLPFIKLFISLLFSNLFRHSSIISSMILLFSSFILSQTSLKSL